MTVQKFPPRSHAPKLKKLILQKVSEFGESTLEALFPYKYPETRLWRKLLGLDPSYKFSKRTFSSILSQLRRDGFIEKIGNSRRHAIWKISAKGSLLVKRKDILESKKDGVPRIISYDIPEKNRKARYWIRGYLLEYNYRQLHKSVWLGLTPLPEEFLKHLDTLSLRDYVHIFGIDKKGTIQNY